MLKLTPTLPDNLPTDKPIKLMWAPLGERSGVRMTATLAPRGTGHLLKFFINVHRTYASGAPIHGTASRTPINITCAAVPNKGWMAKIEGEHTPPWTAQGSGQLSDALKAAENQIVDYAKNLRPLTLAGATAIPAALTVPSGGELLTL